MKTSITTVSISGDLREKLEAISAAGFDGDEHWQVIRLIIGSRLPCDICGTG